MMDGLQCQMCPFHSNSHLAPLPSHPTAGQRRSLFNEDEEENKSVKISLRALQMLHLFFHKLTFANRWVTHLHAHKQHHQ